MRHLPLTATAAATSAASYGFHGVLPQQDLGVRTALTTASTA